MKRIFIWMTLIVGLSTVAFSAETAAQVTQFCRFADPASHAIGEGSTQAEAVRDLRHRCEVLNLFQVVQIQCDFLEPICEAR